MTEVGPLVVVVDEQSEVAVDLGRWRDLAASSLRSCGVDRGEMNVLFVNESTMSDLNRDHMGEDRPTDVLSFPLDGAADDEASGDIFVGDAALIGDIVVCPVYADRQASDHRGVDGHDGSVEDEIALLIVHGVLHVLGHDHAEPGETATMQAHERRLLDAHHRQ